jgi:hypothetical protein
MFISVEVKMKLYLYTEKMNFLIIFYFYTLAIFMLVTKFINVLTITKFIFFQYTIINNCNFNSFIKYN